MIEIIEECSECGLHHNDIKGGLRGHGHYCVWCGAQDSCFRVVCTCGNPNLWINGEELASECSKCGTHSNDFIVTHFDSAYIINEILHRPELHKERTWIPVSFVETIVQYIQSQPQMPQEYKCSVCGETSYSSTECPNACGFGDTMEEIADAR